MATATSTTPPPAPSFFQYGGPYFTGFAAIVAAAVAAFVALRSIRTTRDNLIDQMNLQRELAANASRANVVSNSRQRWIDSLREDLAELITADYIVADDMKVDDDDLSPAELVEHRKRLLDARRVRRLMRRRIQLRLNPDKDSHNELMVAISEVMKASGPEHSRAALALTRKAQRLLRGEWLRVKAEATGVEISSASESVGATKVLSKLGDS